MAQPIRLQQSDAIYLVENICLENQAFFRPSDEVNRIIKSNLAWATDKYDVVLYGFAFHPVRFRLVVGAPRLNLQNFMRDFQSQLAIKLNEFWRRSGKFFKRRYASCWILDVDARCEQFCRTICLPCEDHVDHPDDWSGVSSWELHKSGTPLTATRENRTVFWRLKQSNPGISDREASRRATEHFEIELTPLPAWEHLDAEDLRSQIVRRIETCIKSAEPGSISAPSVSSDVLPLCHASQSAEQAEFEERHAQTTTRHRRATTRLRRNLPGVDYPLGTIPPYQSTTVGKPEESVDSERRHRKNGT